jgi:orotidine-5'-phosphate decarboxylase
VTYNPIIVALDVDSAEQARGIVRHIGPSIDFYKVGLELYTVAGLPFVRELIAEGKQVFLDLKMYDISETVRRAASRVAEVDGIRFVTVHASKAVVKAAVQACQGSALRVLSVTVLTSYDQNDLNDLGHSCSVAELVAHLANKAVEGGTDGLVCSALEVGLLRRTFGDDLVLVTPGVRSAGAGVGDQKRVATPAQAILDGASYLVMGRQITRAQDPASEVCRVLDEISTKS